MANAADKLRGKKTPIRPEGDTDPIGTQAYNLGLSESRARSVADTLEREGIEASRIATIGYGKENPITSNDTEEGRAQNRRVEIIEEP